MPARHNSPAHPFWTRQLLPLILFVGLPWELILNNQKPSQQQRRLTVAGSACFLTFYPFALAKHLLNSPSIMKRILLPATILCFVFAACKTGNDKEKDGGLFGSKTEKAEIDKKITKRDLSITAANAYNNIFMDSSAMEQFFTDEKVNDTLIRRMRSFYNSRNFQYAWFAPEGVTEQGREFWNMFAYYNKTIDTVSVDGQLKKRMNRYVMLDSLSVSPGNKEILKTELQLTRHFINYSLESIEKGFIKRKELERFVPQKKTESVAIADSLVNKEHKDGKYYSDVNEAYGKLLDAMEKYVAIAKAGDFAKLPGTSKLYGKSGTAANIDLLKKRLQQEQYLASGDTLPGFTPGLTAAISNFQTALGYTPTGTITDAQLKDLNKSAKFRVQQLFVNLGRMQWMINNPEAQMIRVNIPEFKLAVLENGKTAFDMNVVVGKDGHNTMMFTGDLSQVVFSPYWNIPESIVKKEIMPALARNPNYLQAKNMERTSDGRYRQLPGDDNSLGRVKFLFPNSFDIYFHDTNAKDLFNMDKRAFSHGCIRLAEPKKLAQYVLKNQPEWDEARIDSAMVVDKEEVVKVKKPIFVLITYYTAWVDENGLLNFRDDIYEHDKRIAAKMFTDAVL